MERHLIASSFDSPLQFFPVSEKQIQNSTMKVKNTSSSTHRRGNQCSSTIMQRMKKLNHAHKTSSVRKNRSKCETQAHQSIKKRNTQNQSLSKKTLRKRKNTKMEGGQSNNKLKLSNQKHEQQSLTLKSSGKRNYNKKQMFNSTCFSRHMDQDLQMLEQMAVHASSDFLQNCTSQSQHSNQKNIFNNILDRTKSMLNSYQARCDELQMSCNFYKNQLLKANNKIEQLNKKNTGSKSKNKNKQSKKDQKQSIRSTYTSKYEKL